ncbi:MAG: radical SAM protein [Chlorobi bacterium]|nr:radical SAM protein [Chlorobiota bacterium]
MQGTRVSDVRRFVGTLTLRKAGNLFLAYAGLYASRIFRQPLVPGNPHTLSVEPTTRCNLACPECPVGNHTLHRPRGDMKTLLFQKIIKDAAPYLTHLILYFQGEPFLAPRFFEMIQTAKSHGLYVSTSTNGHFLSQENNIKLLKSGLDRLLISLDGASAESYVKYRRNGDFNRVVNGIRDLVKQREERGQKNPYIILQCLLFAHNIDEKGKIIQLGAALGVDTVQFKTAQFYHLNGDNQMVPDNPEDSRYRKDNNRNYVIRGRLKNYCTRVWTTAVVTWDGTLVPCCFDKDAKYAAGELRTYTLKKIWKSAILMKFRKQILKDRKIIDICRNCTEGLKKEITENGKTDL